MIARTESERRASARSAAEGAEGIAAQYEARGEHAVAARYFDIASDHWRRAADSTRAGMAADLATRCRGVLNA